MDRQNDAQKITAFLVFAWPVVSQLVNAMLKALGWQITQKGSSLNVIFDIESKGKRAEFHLYNLLLEIATIDRDEQPLRFDHRLDDFEFFLKKTGQLVQSKIAVLYELLSDDDIDSALQKITDQAGNYQRIRIVKWDGKKPP